MNIKKKSTEMPYSLIMQDKNQGTAPRKMSEMLQVTTSRIEIKPTSTFYKKKLKKDINAFDKTNCSQSQ